MRTCLIPARTLPNVLHFLKLQEPNTGKWDQFRMVPWSAWKSCTKGGCFCAVQPCLHDISAWCSERIMHRRIHSRGYSSSGHQASCLEGMPVGRGGVGGGKETFRRSTRHKISLEGGSMSRGFKHCFLHLDNGDFHRKCILCVVLQAMCPSS